MVYSIYLRIDLRHFSANYIWFGLEKRVRICDGNRDCSPYPRRALAFLDSVQHPSVSAGACVRSLVCLPEFSVTYLT